MKKKIILIVMFILAGIALLGCTNENEVDKAETEVELGSLAKKYHATDIVLSDEQILVNGEKISNDSANAVYAANDIVFYPEGMDFTYGEGTKEDEHAQEEADAHTVVHITRAGNYVISGKLSAGQIAVDLGEEADEEEDAVVTLILNNVDIMCSVAPGVIFYEVYECCDEEQDDAGYDVDTTKAGANVIIADDTVNYVRGSYVAKIFKSVELSEDGSEILDSKKLHKYDGTFYSKSTMNISGEEKGNGILNIQAENEGLGSELHLTINGGVINIDSGNDGINTNEDGVSVTTVNGGEVNITVNGETNEGDGIDSNGWLVINGGKVAASACGSSMDSGIDSDLGIHINGGFVAATGNMLDAIAQSEQNYVVFRFEEMISANAVLSLKNEAGEVVCEYVPKNEFSCLVFSTENLSEGTYTLWKDDVQQSVMQMSEGEGPKMREGEMPRIQDGELPQMREGEPPRMQEGEPPRMQKGEPPRMQEGEPPQMPEGAHGWGAKGEMVGMETKKEFLVTSGGNIFGVAAYIE